MPSNLSGDHHEVDFGGGGDVSDGVSGHGNDVGEHAGREDADVAAAEELGGGPGGAARRTHAGSSPALTMAWNSRLPWLKGNIPQSVA